MDSDASALDLNPAIDRLLKRVARLRRPRTTEDFAAALPEFTTFPRYRGEEGTHALYKEFVAAIDAMPRSERIWGRSLLGLDQPEASLTRRREELGESNGTARMYRDRYVLQAALHRLQLSTLEGPIVSASLDTGFEIQRITTLLTARPQNPLTVRHEIVVVVRATRAGLRLLPICYGSNRPLEPAGEPVVSDRSLSAYWLGSFTNGLPRHPPTPLHLFWLSQSPVPGASIRLTMSFVQSGERWSEATSELWLISGGPAVEMRVPRRSFSRVEGSRSRPGDSAATVELSTLFRNNNRNVAVYVPRKPREDEFFLLQCQASDRSIEHQARAVASTV